MAKLDFTGTVLKVGETQEVGSNGFKKRSVVVQEDGGNSAYPNKVEFECHKDDVSILDSVSAGEKVTVTAFVNGRYWEGGDKYFTTLKVASIVSHTTEKATETATPAAAVPGDDTDLPF